MSRLPCEGGFLIPKIQPILLIIRIFYSRLNYLPRAELFAFIISFFVIGAGVFRAK